MAVGVAGEEEGVAGMDMGVVAGRMADIEMAKVQEVHRKKVLWSITVLCPDPERGIQNELFKLSFSPSTCNVQVAAAAAPSNLNSIIPEP